VMLPAAAMLVVLGRRERGTAGGGGGRGAGPWLAFAAGFLVTAGPWLLRNAVWTGNPLYPYLTGILGGPPGLRLAGELRQAGPLPTAVIGWLARVVEAPVIRTFHPLQVGGTLGLQFFVLLPAAAVLTLRRRGPAVPLWIGLCVGTAAWGLLVTFARFAAPELVLGAALAGTAAARLTSAPAGPALRRTFTVLSLFIAGWNLVYLGDRFAVDRALVVTGIRSPERFLATWTGYWPAARWIDRHLPPSAKVILVGEPRSYGIDRDVVVEDPFRPPLLVDLARAARSPSELARALHGMGVTHLLVNPVEMARIARQRGLADYWEDAPPAQRRVIEAFLTGWVRRLFTAPDGVWVGELRPAAAWVD